MKNIMKKLIVIMTILMMFNINLTKESKAAEVTDEFAELLTTYESEAPSIESAELSTTFTSNKEVEVYIKTSRKDISKVNISAWSGGPYKQYLVSKEAKFDELRNVYTVLFPLNEIVNTTTNQIENSSEVLYYFDACIYSTNGSMSYVKLDEVQYTESGIQTQVTKNEEEKQVIEVKAEEDGYVAIVNAGEEVTENTNWQPVSKGVNTYALPEATDEVQNVQVLYKAGAEVTEEDIQNGNVRSNEVMLLATGVEEPEQQDPNMSYFQDNETFTFEFSQNSGANDWIAYTDTPNVLESRIQGMPNTEAVATIKIKTEYPGVLSFDYMVSSEENFDKFLIEIEGAEKTNEVEYLGSLGFSGQQTWENFAQSYATPEDGIITLTLTYSKDFNINRPDDKAAIRNLTFEFQIPEIPEIPGVAGKIIINNGEEFTNNNNLNITLNAQNFTKMYITEVEEKPDASDTSWQSYQNTATYTLKDTTDGVKTVYVYYMNEAGAITLRPIEALIKLDTSVPTTVAPTVESTSNTITAYLNQTDANEFTTVYYGYRLTASGDVEYTWSENIRVNDLADVSEYTISGLTEMQEYDVVTKVSDGVNGDIVSESATIKTKIPSDGIVITKSTEETTLGEVVVNIEWNNTEYIKEYSLDGIDWTEETAGITTITLTENAIIYYRMKNDTYDTGILECEVNNIDHRGPQVEKIEVIEPVSGIYGIDDEITIRLTWDEEAIVVTAPTLNIKFEDNNVVSLTAVEQTSTTLTYKYTIVGTDAGYLSVESLTGGLVKDNLNNESTYELPKLTGSKIFVENMAYIASTNKYYGTLQRAINAAGTEATTIKLIANNILRDTVVIKEGQNIVLDLNGKTVSYESEENIVTAIENRGTLEIYDSTAENAGLILASSKTKSAYTIVNNSTGNITIKDIKVEAISNTEAILLESYALYNKGAGTVTLGMNDSDVSVIKPELKATAKNSYGLYIANAEGTINYYDGIIKGNTKAISITKGSIYNMPAGYLEKVELRNEDGKDYEVAYLSNESAVELTMNGITTGYKSIFEALAKIPTDGRQAKIKMLTDETLTEIIKIYNGQNIEIDLNGHVLTRTEDIDGYLYALINNGTLKISDTSEAQTGEIRAIASNDVTTYAVYNYTDGDLTIDGGKLFAQINNSNKTKYAYGLENSSNTNIIISNGEIYREQYFFDHVKVETASGKYLNQRYETIDGIEYKVNYISTSPNVTLTVNGVTTGHTGVQQAVNASPTDGTQAIIKMEQDEELVSYIQVPENKNIQLNLNGKTIIVNNLIYGIQTGATLLEIIDSSIEQTGTICSSSYTSNLFVIDNTSSGTVKINGGTISTFTLSSSYNAYGVCNSSGGIVEINGGVISAVTSFSSSIYGVCNSNGGIVKINGGTISSTETAASSSYDVYGVYNSNSGIVEINGGTISCSSTTTSSYGVYNKRNGTVEINGGTLCCTTTSSYSSYGVYNASSGTVKINGGTISSLKIIKAYNTTSHYGLYNYSNGIIEINGGKIFATTTYSPSYGVFINNKDSKVKLTGGEWKGRTSGIYIPEGMQINNNGTDETGKINLPLNKHIGYLEEGEYIVNYLDDGEYVAELTIGETITQYTSIQDAIYNIPIDSTLAKVKLLQNESLGRSIEIKAGQNVEIDLNGKELRGNLKINIINDGDLKIIDSSTAQTGEIRSVYTPIPNHGDNEGRGIENKSNGTLEINGGTISSSSSSTSEYFGVDNSGTVGINGSTIQSSGVGVRNLGGRLSINEGKISAYNDSIYNIRNGTVNINASIIRASNGNGVYNGDTGIIEINGSTINSSSTGVYNYNTGIIEITGGKILSSTTGVHNREKGTIIIGKNDDVLMNNQVEIIARDTGIKINNMGASINLYEGIIKAKTPIYPTNTLFQTINEISETDYIINIPAGTEICDGTEGQLKTKYLKFKDDYVPSGDNITDTEAPYISSIEVISPESGDYAKGNIVILKTNWSEEINTTLDTVPELKIKFESDTEKSASVKDIGSNYITYEYVINEEDNGYLKVVSYLNGNVTDNNGNNYQQTRIKLIGNEIRAGTKAYISTTDKYYYNLQQAIDSCELNATVYTNIQLLNDNCYFSEITINETQKIEIDLNGKEIIVTGGNTITNNGDLRIIDSSATQKGALSSSKYNSSSCVVHNASSGIVEINGGTIGGSSSYGVYNASSGTVKINGGTISSSSYGVYNASNGTVEINGGTISSSNSYGVYIKNKEAKIKLTGGEWKGNTNGIYIPEGMEINNTGIEEIGKVNLPQNKHIGYRIDGEYIVNYIEDGEYVAELTIGDTITQYTSIQDAISNIPADNTLGVVKLLQNESLGRSIVIKAEQNVEIDLNGKEIRGDIDKVIVNNGDLRIIDSSTIQKGTINNSYNYVVYNANGGTVEINGGTISSTNSDGVYNASSGIVKINGGTLDSSSYGVNNARNGTIEINGGTNSSYNGVRNASNGTVKINGGTLNSSSDGVDNESSGTVEINGGTISSNYAVNNESDGTVEINGGTISASFNGVLNASSGTVKINGGTISTTNSSSSSYGVYIKDKEAKIKFTGGELKGRSNGIYIPDEMKINNSETEEIGKVNIPQGKHIGYRIDGEYVVNYIEDGEYVAELTIGDTITQYVSIQDAINNIPTDNTLAKVKVLQNESLGRSIEIKAGQNVEIDLNGKEIRGNIEKIIINNGDLRIIDSSVTQSGTISHFSDGSCYGVYNASSGMVEINGGTISLYSLSSVGKSYGVYNASSGTIEINGGVIEATVINSSWSKSYGIYNASTGKIEINGGKISAFNGNQCYGVYFNNTDSYFYFNGGKILGKINSIYPTTKSIELQPNTYVKNYRENIGGTNYFVAEVAPTSNIKVINNGNISYYEDLKTAMSTTAAPANNTLTEITLMADADILSDITIANGQKILLDLNGKTINVKEYNSISVRKPFINNGIYEIMDSVGSGQINIESTGYDDYGIYNNNTTAKYKMYGGTMNVTSIGNNAYGIYNYRSTTDGITIEGGSINVTAKQAENGVTSGKAYGIYNAYSDSSLNVVVTGENTNIIATSELNDSYGYYSTYSEKLTLGVKDGIVDNVSPYIVGGTNGIYKTSGTISMYDGEITGPQNASVSKNIDNIEDETIVYVLNNYDGTESTMLLKEVEELIVIPQDINFKEINAKQEIEAVYSPIDASNVVVDYKVADESIAEVRMEEGKYVVVSRGNGATTITFTVTDMSGKVLTAVCNVAVDDELPSDTAPSAVSTATTVTITCNQTDEIGIDTNSIMYAISSDNGATWSEWTNRKTINGLTADTEYLVKTKVSDMSGNESESQTTAIRTKLPNNSTLVLQPDTVTNTDVKVLVTWNNTEGLPQYYKVGEGEWTLVTGETTEITVTESNVTVYTKLVYDGTEDSNINYILVDNIDRITPNGTISINEDVANYDGSITLNISATDDANVAGDMLGTVAYMYLTTENLTEAPTDDDEKWMRWEGNNSTYPFMLTAEGTGTVYMYLKDKAGNISSRIVSDTVEYNPPVVVLFEDDIAIGEYNTINEAYTAARTGNTNPSIIRVYKSHTMTSQLSIASNKNIVLDLNGRIVSSALSTAISNSGTLEIADSLGSGTFTNTKGYSSTYAIYNTKNLIISGGTIEARNTTSGSYKIYAVYNTGNAATINMTGGKIYATSTRSSSSASYPVYGIYNYSYYTTSDSVVITGGTIEVDALNYCYGYGIYNYTSGRIIITDANIIVNSKYAYSYGIYCSGSGGLIVESGKVEAKSSSSSGYGIYNANSSCGIRLGVNDGIASTTTPEIYGKSYGIYRSNGTYYFCGGVIKGPKNNSISFPSAYLVLPQYHGIVKTVENNIENTTLQFDNSAPTVESLVITTDTDVNTQTVTAVNINDIGIGVVAYMFSQNSTVPTRNSTYWTSINSTNGPTDITNTVNANGTWYFWVMDGAGNVSETKSITAENIHIKATDATLNNVTVPIGKQTNSTLTLYPNNSDAKKITYVSSDESVAYVHPETGVISGLKIGTTTLTATILNYDNSMISRSATITVVESAPQILAEPQDRTVAVGTTTEFKVEANGENLEYQWYIVEEENVIPINAETSNVFKSNIEGQANAVSTDTIIINSSFAGTLSFDYMVSSEDNDIFTITIEDANGTTTAVNNISGEVDWTSYSADFTPNGEGKIIITLTYTKNGSVDGGLDYGAIRNLSWYYFGNIVVESTYTNDEYFNFKTPDLSIYDTTTDTTWIKTTEDGETVYKSSNAGIHNSASTATITIKTSMAGTLSFDYAIYSESKNYDYLIINLIDGNGTRAAVPQAGGTSQSGWKSYSTTVTPNANGEVKLTLLYRKDVSVSTNPDRGAIKNLKIEASGSKTGYCIYENDSMFEISNSNWDVCSYEGANSSSLTVPGTFVTNTIDGTKYYATVSNSSGVATSRQALLTIAEETIAAGAVLGKNAPTLVVENQTITATCNQIGEGITATYYAISADDITYSEWQESNIFTELERGKMYYVKTKIITATSEQESVSAYALIPIYMLDIADINLDQYYYDYDGTAKRPIPTVMYKGTTLKKDTDYTVSYNNNIDAGTGYVVVTGTDKYTGSIEGTFTIYPKYLEVIWTNTQLTHNGNPQAPTATAESGIDGEVINLAVRGYKTDVGINYSASVDRLNSTVTGGRNKISNYEFNNDSTLFNIGIDISTALRVNLDNNIFEYAGIEQRPEPTVTMVVGNKETLLVKNEDYLVSYRDNLNVGKAYVIVSAIGMYSGVVEYEFEIIPKQIETIWSNTILAYSGIAQAPIVGMNNTLNGVNGEILNIAVTGEQKERNEDYVAIASISSVTRMDGTEGLVTNYELINTTTEFDIIQRDINDSEIISEVSTKVYTYDGTAKEPNAQVTIGDITLIKDQDYTISYTNNVNAGTAIAMLTGIGNYNGTKDLEFKIKQYEVTVTWNNTILMYTGNPQKPTVTDIAGVNGELLKLEVAGDQTEIGRNYAARARIISVEGGQENIRNYMLINPLTTFEIVRNPVLQSPIINAKLGSYNGKSYVSGMYTNKSVLIELTTTENINVVRYEWSTSKDSGFTTENLTTVNEIGRIIFDEEMNQKIYFRVVDDEGYYSDVSSIEIMIDTTKPTGNIDILDKYKKGELEYVNSNTVQINITAEDNASETENIDIAFINEKDFDWSNNNKDLVWMDYEALKTWNLTPGEGLRTVYVIFKDEAGNQSVYLAEVNVEN